MFYFMRLCESMRVKRTCQVLLFDIDFVFGWWQCVEVGCVLWGGRSSPWHLPVCCLFIEQQEIGNGEKDRPFHPLLVGCWQLPHCTVDLSYGRRHEGSLKGWRYGPLLFGVITQKQNQLQHWTAVKAWNLICKGVMNFKFGLAGKFCYRVKSVVCW